MLITDEHLIKVEGAYGSPAEAEMRYGILPFEHDVVVGSMGDGRSHDVTMFIRSIEDSRRVAVIRKHFFPPGAYRAPSGAAHGSETIDQGAVREALEETGLEIELLRYLVRIRARFECPGKEPISWTSHVFDARQVSGELDPIDTNEIDEARWASLGEIQGPIRAVLLDAGWGLFRYRVALTDLAVEAMEAAE